MVNDKGNDKGSCRGLYKIDGIEDENIAESRKRIVKNGYCTIKHRRRHI